MIRDWKIVLEPRSDGEPGGCLDIVRTDEEDAVCLLELYADTIEQMGCVPRGLDWQNESPAHIVRRVGRKVFAVRVDCFERETASGYSSGAGWLKAVPA